MDCICAICFDPCIQAKSPACAIDLCGHMFHISCLVTWEARCERKVCAICSRNYQRIIHLFPSSSTDEPVVPLADPNSETKALKNRVAELERQLEEVHLESPERTSSTMEIRKKLILEQMKSSQFEVTIDHLEDKMNTLAFKLSMYEEMFGKECSDQFDKIINGQIEDDEMHAGEITTARPRPRPSMARRNF